MIISNGLWRAIVVVRIRREVVKRLVTYTRCDKERTLVIIYTLKHMYTHTHTHTAHM